jgi:hypothetical protein
MSKQYDNVKYNGKGMNFQIETKAEIQEQVSKNNEKPPNLTCT